MVGSPKQVGVSSNLQGGQQAILDMILQQLGPGAVQGLGQLAGGGSPEEQQKLFQQAFVDPAMLAYQQDILPAIQSQFGNLNAGSSSALNQALARSARDVSTQIGAQAGQFAQNQDALRLQALNSIFGLGLNPYGEAIIQKPLTSDLIGAAGTLGGAYLGTRGR